MSGTYLSQAVVVGLSAFTVAASGVVVAMDDPTPPADPVVVEVNVPDDDCAVAIKLLFERDADWRDIGLDLTDIAVDSMGQLSLREQERLYESWLRLLDDVDTINAGNARIERAAMACLASFDTKDTL